MEHTKSVKRKNIFEQEKKSLSNAYLIWLQLISCALSLSYRTLFHGPLVTFLDYIMGFYIRGQGIYIYGLLTTSDVCAL